MTEAAGDQATPARDPRLPEGEICCYSAAHAFAQRLATAILDCGQVGAVPACERCASFYERMGGRRLPDD